MASGRMDPSIWELHMILEMKFKDVCLQDSLMCPCRVVVLGEAL